MAIDWTPPITWAVDQLVTADILNEQIRDNISYLLNPSHNRILRDNSGTYTITNVTTFQDIDGANLSISLEIAGGPVLVRFQASGYTNGAAHEGYFDIAVDGVRVGASFTQGLATLVAARTGTEVYPINMTCLLTGLSAGTYVIRPQWRTSASDTVTLLANTTTNPVLFEAIEL